MNLFVIIGLSYYFIYTIKHINYRPYYINIRTNQRLATLGIKLDNPGIHLRNKIKENQPVEFGTLYLLGWN